MEQFENEIPFPLIAAGFVCLTVFSTWLQSRLKERKRIKDGQIVGEGTRTPTIEERVRGNSDWSSGEIKSAGKGLMFGLWLLAAVWELTLGTAFIKSFSNPEIKTPAMIVLGVLSTFGLIPVFFAIRATMQHFRYGVSRCFITGKAGVLGKSIAGLIRTSQDVEAEGDYVVELQCVETYSTGSGKNRKTEVKVHWQEKKSIPHQGKSTRAGIPFSFSLPGYPYETGYQLARGNVNWQLTIKAPVKGVDYSAMFVVPVFKMD